MGIIGFNFNKILAEKSEQVKGKINISNNVNISSIDKVDMGIKDQTGLKFSFVFNSTYEPKMGKIAIEGDVVYLGKKDETKKILDEWKKNKKVTPDVMEKILNTVLAKCNVEALILSRDINLPPPLQLPKVAAKKE